MATVTRQSPKKRPTKKRPVRPVGYVSPDKRRKPKSKNSFPKKTRERGFLGKSPLSLVVYGPSGVGKTSLAAHFPKPGFIIDPHEEGIRTLTEFKQAPEPEFIEEVPSFEKLLEFNADLAAGEHDIQTAVYDSLTGIEKLCFIHHCEEHFDGDWSSKGFYSYQQGPKNAAKTDWPEFLSSLDQVRKAGINVVLIAHATVKPYANPDGADYDRHIPYLDKETWAATHRWSKAVCFYNYHVEVEKKGPRNKADPNTESRFIYPTWSPAFEAKNQYGLEPLIDAGESGEEAFNAFREAFASVAGK